MIERISFSIRYTPWGKNPAAALETFNSTNVAWVEERQGQRQKCFAERPALLGCRSAAQNGARPLAQKGETSNLRDVRRHTITYLRYKNVTGWGLYSSASFPGRGSQRKTVDEVTRGLQAFNTQYAKGAVVECSKVDVIALLCCP